MSTRGQGGPSRPPLRGDAFAGRLQQLLGGAARGLHERDVRLDVGAAGTLAGGRGMLLIGELADDWGTRERDGKVVWARFSLRE